jgi:hypothetical protein
MDTVTDVAAAEAATKPVKVFRDRRLSVSIFRNRTTVRDREVTFHNIYLQRSYKDGEAYKTTHSLGKDDLPAAQLLLAQAWEWIVNEEAKLRQKVGA